MEDQKDLEFERDFEDELGPQKEEKRTSNEAKSQRNTTSVGEIFRTIMIAKWIAFIVAIFIALAGTLAFYFGYNYSKNKYEATFSIDFPGSNALSPLYPDNSPFFYREIISYENLIYAKNSSAKFKNVNVKEMHDNGDITIVRRCNSLDDSGYDVSYVIKVNAKYFTSAQVATEYINKLAHMPVNHITGLANDRGLYIANYVDTPRFGDKLDLINQQADYLIEGLQSLADNTSGASAYTCIQIVSKLNLLKDEVKETRDAMLANFYVHDVDEEYDYYSNRAILLEREYNIKYEAYQSVLALGNIDGDAIVALAEEVSRLSYEMNLCNEYLSRMTVPEDGSDFDSRMSTLYNDVYDMTRDYEELLGAYYETSSLVSFNGSVVIRRELSLGICILIGLLIGIVIAAIVAYVFGKHAKNSQPKENKTKKEGKSNKDKKVAEGGNKANAAANGGSSSAYDPMAEFNAMFNKMYGTNAAANNAHAANTAPTANTISGANTAPTANNAHAANAAPTANTISGANTTPTANTISGANTAPTANTIPGAHTAPAANTISGAHTAPTANTISGAHTAPAANTIPGANTIPTANTISGANAAYSANNISGTNTTNHIYGNSAAGAGHTYGANSTQTAAHQPQTTATQTAAHQPQTTASQTAARQPQATTAQPPKSATRRPSTPRPANQSKTAPKDNGKD